MREKLITFETAELAKELGFNVPTFNYFYKNGNEVQESCVEEYPFNPIDWNNNTPEDYSRPSQSLLQKWIREVHNIHICIEIYEIEENKYKWYSQVVGKNLRELADEQNEDSEDFDTFEEALEYGLQEALKLINNEK